MNGVRCLPDVVVQAALGGKHHPVNPHRQRLLVAAHKAAAPSGPDKIPATTSNAPTKKKKPNIKETKKASETATKAEKAPEESPLATPDSSPKPTTSNDKPSKQKRAPYPDTAYNIARKQFFSLFLVSIQPKISDNDIKPVRNVELRASG